MPRFAYLPSPRRMARKRAIAHGRHKRSLTNSAKMQSCTYVDGQAKAVGLGLYSKVRADIDGRPKRTCLILRLVQRKVRYKPAPKFHKRAIFPFFVLAIKRENKKKNLPSPLPSFKNYPPHDLFALPVRFKGKYHLEKPF